MSKPPKHPARPKPKSRPGEPYRPAPLAPPNPKLPNWKRDPKDKSSFANWWFKGLRGSNEPDSDCED